MAVGCFRRPSEEARQDTFDVRVPLTGSSHTCGKTYLDPLASMQKESTVPRFYNN